MATVFSPPQAVVQFTGPISLLGPNDEVPSSTISTQTLVPGPAAPPFL